MEIKNTTVLIPAKIASLQRLLFWKEYRFMFLLCFLVFIGCTVFSSDDNMSFLRTVGSIFFALPLVVFFAFLFRQRAVNKSNKAFRFETTFHFTFLDKMFTVQTINSDMNNTGTLSYSCVFKIVETKDWVFFYLATEGFLPIMKSGFAPGDAEALMAHLRSLPDLKVKKR